MTDTLSIYDFDYPLPDDRIAKFPLAERDSSKLLLWKSGDISESIFRNIGDHIPEGSLLVFNNTRVVRARIIMHKESGARIEVFCLEPYDPADYERAFAAKGSSMWVCMVGNLKKWKDEPIISRFETDGREYNLKAEKAGTLDGNILVHFSWDADLSFGQLLEHLGRIPIPPYLNRESEEIDNTRYQTVYSRFEGSVAAPTAGLHFTTQLIEKLKERRVGFEEVTLHVGAGTFLPVKEENPENHTMHTEHFEVTLPTLRKLITHAGQVIPVGTTSVRTLESMAALGYRAVTEGHPRSEEPVGQWEPYAIPEDLDGAALLGELAEYMEREGAKKLKAATQIMIRPGYRFRVANGMVTNFHQPKSTLLLLVSAFTGGDWQKMYDYALENDFRFLSYGDSSLLLR